MSSTELVGIDPMVAAAKRVYCLPMNETRILPAVGACPPLSNLHQHTLVEQAGSGLGEMASPETAVVCGAKFYILDSQTAEFLRCDSTWAPDLAEALPFLSVKRAIYWGMRELKDSFQVLKVEASQIVASVSVVIPTLPWSKVAAPTHQVTGLRPQPPLLNSSRSAIRSLMSANPFNEASEFSRVSLTEPRMNLPPKCSIQCE